MDNFGAEDIMPLESADFWMRALEFIKKDLANEQTYNIWFSPIKFISMSSDSFVLEVPNKFSQEWLLDRYMPLITASVQKAAGIDLRIEFVLGEGAGDGAPAETKTAEPKKEAKPFWPFARAAQDTAKEIGLSPKYTFDSFVIGASNRFSHAAALAVSESPAKAYNPLFIYGGVGLGKTHLMHAIGQNVLHKTPRAKVLYMSSEEFTNQLISR